MNTGANGEPASHGEMPSRQPTQTPEDRVGSALLMKDQVVSAVVMAAESLGGSPRRELLRLSDQIAYATDAEAIYRNPLALEVFLPLIHAPRKTDGTDRRVHQNQVDELVCGALLKQPSGAAAVPDMLTRLAYPLSVFSICAAVLTAICTLLVPIFEEMFDEFGLDLPAPTRLLVAVSHLLRTPVAWILIGLLATVTAALLFRRAASQWWRHQDPIAQRRFSSAMSLRGSSADWAWHLSMLIESGFSISEAIEIAGASSKSTWLRRASRDWAQQLRNGRRPFESLVHFRNQPCHLLAYALTFDDLEMSEQRAAADADSQSRLVTSQIRQAGLLREIANLYWDRERLRSYGWWAWLSPLTTVLVGLMVGFVVIALFMPLISLISGLA